MTGWAGDAGAVLAESAGFWLWGYLPVLDVGDGRAPVGATVPLFILPNAPNPFDSETRIRYWLSREYGPAPVRIEIYDVTGRLVRTLDAGVQSPGPHAMTWDGRNRSGHVVHGGVYVCRVTAGSFQVSQRITLVR